MQKPWGRTTLLVLVVTVALVLAPGGAVLADPATPLAGAIEATSGTAADVAETVTDAASAATETVTETAAETAENVTVTVEEAVETVAATAGETTETVTETVEEAVETVTETGSEAAEGVVETASDASQTVVGTASGAGESAEDALDGAGAAPTGTTVDPTEPRHGAAGPDDLEGTVTSSSIADMAPGIHAEPAVVLGAPTTLGAGPVVEDVRGSGSVSWVGEGGALDAASRFGLSSGDTEATCETNLHRGVETASVPCHAGASVLGLTLGVTGVAVLSLLILALALSGVGTGALALERRLQRG